MSEYILLVIGTVLTASVFTAILPNGKLQSVISGITKLVCVLTIIAPIAVYLANTKKLNFFDENSKEFFPTIGIETDSSFIQYYSELRIEWVEGELEKELLNQFERQVSVQMDWRLVDNKVDNLYEDTQIQITKISLYLKENTDKEVKTKMWQYVKENYCSEVLIE